MAPFVAIAALGAFGYFIAYLLWQTATQVVQWTRDVYVVGGVEAPVPLPPLQGQRSPRRW